MTVLPVFMIFFINFVIIDVLFKNPTSRHELIYMNFRFVWENKQVTVAKINLKIWNSVHFFLRFPCALLGLAVKFWLEFIITLPSVINRFKNFFAVAIVVADSSVSWLCLYSKGLQYKCSFSNDSTQSYCTSLTSFEGGEKKRRRRRGYSFHTSFQCVDLLLQ